MISEEVKALDFMVNCPAWGALYKARLAEKSKDCMVLLIDPSADRKEKETDDYLRGWIKALQWAVAWPELLVKEAVDNDGDDPHI